MTQRRPYAAGTYVGIGRTKDEISEELTRLGAIRKSIAEDDQQHLAVIQFERSNQAGLLIRYRIVMRLADPTSEQFQWTPARRYRLDADDARKAWRQDCMERWRALGAYVKALRLAAEAAIATTEEILAAYIVLPNGQTAHEYLADVLPEGYVSGALPPFLPGVSPTTTAPAAPRLPSPPSGHVTVHEAE